MAQPDITAIALTGIGGAGKSTLGALVYRYVEAQQGAGKGAFTAPPLWLRVDPAVTMADILGNLCSALNVPAPDLAALSPQSQAAALFGVLHSAGKGRLVVFDQFENLLDDDGCALPDRPGIGEWLDALNSQPCACRVLLTSRPDPKGTRDDPYTYLQPYHVPGLAEVEGIELLRKRDVQATEAEMRSAVQRCGGHAFSLTLLATRLQQRNLTLASLLNDPHYTLLWTGDIAQKLLDAIYNEQLDSTERTLLAAFSVFREPIPSEAAQTIMPVNSEIPTEYIEGAIDGLLTQHLLQAAGEGRCQPHAIVAEYARDHIIEGKQPDRQANRQALLAAHARAAQYYRQRAATTCPSPEKRRKVADVHDLIEATWQYCQAEQWQQAYDLMIQEGIFADLKLWGGNTILLELYQLLLSDKWHPEPLQAGDIYKDLGFIYGDLGKSAEALGAYEKALSIYKEVEDRGKEGQTLVNLGWVNNLLGQQKKALKYYEEGLSIARELENRKEEGRALNNLGGVYDALGQKQQALEYYEQALRIYREVGDRSGEGTTLNNLGGVYDALGQKQQALEYYEQALLIRREVGDRSGEGTTLWNIGAYYFDQSRYDVALASFLLARDIFEEVQSPNHDEVQGWIDDLRKKVGEEQFRALLARVEPRAQQLVEQALIEDVGETNKDSRG
ncbi:MAG TPA: tetratricopeptide repeat protein [Ktedonobacteraceae bacterium]|nr:tetratricopeptide repeat protein [Ktedonobacteraceae bacterium]